MMNETRKNVENNAVMQIRLPLQLREEFQTICKREGYSGSGLVKKWIREFVGKSAASKSTSFQMD